MINIEIFYVGLRCHLLGLRGEIFNPNFFEYWGFYPNYFLFSTVRANVFVLISTGLWGWGSGGGGQHGDFGDII